jgi:tetratricopeptide (TPR) repeat protein
MPALLAMLIAVQSLSASAQPVTTAETPRGEPLLDPFDPFDIGDLDDTAGASDEKKSAEELLGDAFFLLRSERPLDARTKLLKALQKDPSLYRTHYLLAGYYLVHVGHFRLAMKYIKRTEELFEKKYGPPPYTDRLIQLEHGDILYYLSQIQLSLDNYQGSLDTLDRFQRLGYSSEWYAGARAWVLMKLGRIQEAIKVARAGVLAGSEPGRTLNMLGILLSMNGQPQEALEVFRRAIASEFSAGSEGQPATPLNNSGEVYKEIFEDDKAESAFLRATSLPDGCEHVLPSLNLTLMYVDQQKHDAAISTLDSFQRCIAQFPLRNNEEHVALVSLARGRIDLHTGNVDRAIRRFRTALNGTQWFGKIGTNQNDLVVAATISLSQALTRKNNAIRTRLPLTWTEWASQKKEIAENAIEAWWLMRRARQILTGDLNDIEDLTIRNTDSLIEYPTLGEPLRGLSSSALSNRIAAEQITDERATAKLFYQAYLAENVRSPWNSARSNQLLEDVIERARPRYDDLLKTHATLLRMQGLPSSSPRYEELAYRVFYTSPAELRNYGLPLPVQIIAPSDVRANILSGPFLEARAERAGSLCTIESSQPPGAPLISLRFTCPGNAARNRTVEDSDPREVVNKLTEALFREEINNGGNI